MIQSEEILDSKDLSMLEGVVHWVNHQTGSGYGVGGLSGKRWILDDMKKYRDLLDAAVNAVDDEKGMQS